MNFCSECGEKVRIGIPDDDNRPRHICDACHTIHYHNPKIVAGTVPVYGDKVLLCKRAIEPRIGYWTLPAGFMENEETTVEAAARETWEEAQAKVDISHLYVLIDTTVISQVYMMFLADMPKPEYAAGPESLEVELFAEEDIPWGELAFPTIEKTLRLYFEDRRKGSFPMHQCDVNQEDRDRFYAAIEAEKAC
ncbi:NUDIX hydrolase [Oceanospirillum linum]|uniref:NUDIX hydrolase n=1 Tax=Oceanospirillum linum TaxID=966 RepID=A0A1T1HB98_OCELI|nr:NUDIX hydrolase [Oceanospirillum linum]OOV87092.1 NUDIX hydrolase [Oceanospirillum linum]SEF74152.1 ADP-ribose pyrophosphatase YjhB, NUDIX family [Oleiphilus messinensis]SMP16619.1 ADP-ribose pyrophosphatase YjhB, NUDIX family [Oceanospirillum linum]